MMEAKLKQAAQSLPCPASNFSQIEEKAYRSQDKTLFRVRRYRLAATVIICAAFLISGAAIAATTEVRYSAWATSSDTFESAEKAAAKLGAVLPERLDDSPFYRMTEMYVVPEGTSYLEAIYTPVYRWYGVNYGVQEIVRTDHSESSVIYDKYSISIGSADGELCHYVFSLDESGAWALDNTLPGSYRTEQYNGITMQIGTTVQYDRENKGTAFAYHHRVIWVDGRHNVVFTLHKSFYAEEETADQIPDEMIAFAKEIIDVNAAEN